MESAGVCRKPVYNPRSWPLTGVCKNEIIATNRPRHSWIPASAVMSEWAWYGYWREILYLTKPVPVYGLTFNLVSPKCNTYPCQRSWPGAGSFGGRVRRHGGQRCPHENGAGAQRQMPKACPVLDTGTLSGSLSCSNMVCCGPASSRTGRSGN